MRAGPGFNGQLQPKWFAVPVPNFASTGASTPTPTPAAVTFNGGSLDGSRGLLGADDKPFIAFSGDNHREVSAGTGTGCFVQKD